jgi:protocatechuate 3,4-dioxygenase beta subunit
MRDAKWMTISLMALFASCLVTAYASALDPVLTQNCQITPQIWGMEPMPKIANTSQLRHATGSPIFDSGEYVTIIGRVLDEQCVPLTNAVVSIWYQPPAREEKNLKTGSTLTDNNGFFSFAATMPQSPQKINVHIAHPSIMPVETRIFFSEQRYDIEMRSVSPNQRQLLIAKLLPIQDVDDTFANATYQIDIVVEGRIPYKEY